MIEVTFSLDEDSDCYVVYVESGGSSLIGFEARLDRTVVENVVYTQSKLSMELMPDGRVAAFPDISPGTTLATASLRDLVANCERSLKHEADVAELCSLKRELESALAVTEAIAKRAIDRT